MVAVAGYRGTSAQEKSEMPAAAAPYATVIPTAKVFDGAGIWPQDLWLYQKDDGTFRLVSRKPLDGLDILTPKIEIKMFQLLIYCFLLWIWGEERLENRARKVAF